MTAAHQFVVKWCCAYECTKCSAPGTSGLAVCPLLGFWSADGTYGGHTYEGRWPR